jgi:uncharacterized membrane protein YhaH (DUF805 family)
MTASSLDHMQPQAGFKLFTLRGRLGRARYVLACMGAVLAAYVFLLVIGSLLALFGRFGAITINIVAMILYFALLPVYIAMLTVRRAHDFNLGGWIALLILTPLLSPWFSIVPLLFWFMPGTRGDNNYGPALPQEKLAIKALATGLPIFLLIVFFATVKPHAVRPTTAPSTSTLQQYKP